MEEVAVSEGCLSLSTEDSGRAQGMKFEQNRQELFGLPEKVHHRKAVQTILQGVKGDRRSLGEASTDRYSVSSNMTLSEKLVWVTG